TLDATLAQLDAIGLFAALNQRGLPTSPDTFMFDIDSNDPPAVLNKGVLNKASNSWTDLSPRFVVDYHFNDDTMGYASLAKGYKAGGFNSLQIGSDFDNEDVWNFETGIKDRKSTRLNSSHVKISYAVFCLKKKIERKENISKPKHVQPNKE